MCRNIFRFILKPLIKPTWDCSSEKKNRSTAVCGYPAGKISSYKNARDVPVLRLVHATLLLRGTPCKHLATDLVRSKVPPLYVPVSPVARLAWSKPCRWTKISTNNWSSYVGRKEVTNMGIQKKNIGEIRRLLSTPPARRVWP